MKKIDKSKYGHMSQKKPTHTYHIPLIASLRHIETPLI